MRDGENPPEGALTATVPKARSGRALLAAGARIGRFLVVETLGEGAMGVVVAAYDPQLDRRVALKLLQPTAWSGAAPSEGRARLLREARAMANLSHPNVLTVYDVGTVEDQVFVAMEYCSGGTLRGYCGDDRSWREVVSVFAMAGAGLAAAHRAGLVHRDFKPDNVLLTADGQVRVADFGLVGVVGAGAPQQTSGDAVGLLATLSVAGSLLGTPAYMAPEQHLREPAGPAADQFAFCVALWEALYRERPFEGRGYEELRQNVIDGRLRPVPPSSKVAPWIHTVLARGLQRLPDQRYPSMDALLEALDADPGEVKRRRRRSALIATALVGIGAITTVAVKRGTDRDRITCTGSAERLAGVWNERARAAMRTSFASSGRPYAASTFERVASVLDTYASSWTAARTDACEATHVRGEQSPALLDLRMACLDRRLGEVSALVGVLTEKPDGDIVDHAVTAVSRVTPVSSCADAQALTAAPPPPQGVAARMTIEAARSKLARAKAEQDAGRGPAGLLLARAAAVEARTLGWAPLRAEALLRVGWMLDDNREAETTLYEAAAAAVEARDANTEALAWNRVMWDVGYGQGRLREAWNVRPLAEAAVARGAHDPVVEATLLNTMGVLLDEEAKFDEAQTMYLRSLALREKALGRDHPEVSAALNNIGDSFHQQGKYAEALAALERSLAIKEKVLGADHPHVAATLQNLGNTLVAKGDYETARIRLERAVTILEASGPHGLPGPLHNLANALYKQGKLAEARRHLERAVAIGEAEWGESHPQLAGTLLVFGEVARAERRYDEARRHVERALAIERARYGPDHPNVAMATHVLANVYQAEGRTAQARALFESTLAILTKTVGADHPQTLYAAHALGETLASEGRHREALPHFERAVAGFTARFGAAHPDTASALFSVARALLHLGRSSDAVAPAEQALGVYEQRKTSDVAAARFLLARALWESSPARARSLARRAWDELAGQGDSATRREVQRWLAARGGLPTTSEQ